MSALVLLVIVVVAAAVIYGVKVQRQRIAAAWNEAARRLDMGIVPGSAFRNPEILGEVDDISIKVDTFTRRSGNNSQTYTRYRVRYPSAGVDFELRKQTAFSAVTKFFGAQDVEIGDQEFDDIFVIKSDDPMRVTSVITPTRRTSILQLILTFPGIRITDSRLQWERRGVTSSADQIVTVVRRLVGAAYVLAEGGAATQLDPLLEARNAGDLEESARLAREAEPGAPLEVRRVEAETLAEARDPQAAERFAELAEELPDDEEIRAWQERTAELQSPPPETTPVPAEPTSFDAGAISDDLFGESRLSFETSRRFDELYRGTVVRWSGPVRSSREYQRDPKLGEEPGTRVVVTVARIENDLYGQTTVDAVIGLPPGNANSMRGREEITFEGTLVGIDAMMRNLFVAHASVV